jgi:beta-lactamase superfamily II metal-dependent hydrolase
MYQVGFGDCFLITFPGDHHLLIDCGVHQKDDDSIIPGVVADIKQVTNGRLGVVLATHEHYDHISGFAQVADLFKSMTTEEVWLPWTVNQKNPSAAMISAMEMKLIEVLKLQGLTELAQSYVLEFYSNKTAFNTLKGEWSGKQPKIRWLPDEEEYIETAALPGVEFQLLGPQRNNPYISIGDPDESDAYLALLTEMDGGDWKSPFLDKYFLNKEEAFKKFPTLNGKEPLSQEDLIQSYLAANGIVKNNRSITLLIKYGEALMLFPGDMQYGGWKSIYDSTDFKSKMSDVDLIKISHHGSHNGTPRSLVDGIGRFISLVSTKTIRGFENIPYHKLVGALNKCGPVIMSNNPPKKTLYRSKYSIVPGDFWTDVRIRWTN